MTGPAGALRLLLDGRLDEWLAAARPAGGPLVFVHVPKTAGTSLRAELAARLQPDANIEVDYADATRLFRHKMDDAVAAFLAGPARRVRFASGHLMGRHFAQLRAALPGARFVTLLRDPVRRVVSDYHHQRSARHPSHEAFRARFATLADYAGFPAEHDKAAQHLVAPAVLAARDPVECVDHLLRSYDFVGVQEEYALCFRMLAALAGRPGAPALRENVGSEEAASPVGTAIADAIRAANPLDAALHAAVAAGWRARAGAIASWLDRTSHKMLHPGKLVG